MKYISRSLKGTHGYLKKQLVFEIIKTAIMFAMALGLFFIGYLTLHTKQSLWSVFAVLAFLPASKSLVGVIMLARFKSISDEDYDEYSKVSSDVSCIYENVITTSAKSYFIPVMACADNTVIGYYPNGDSNDIKAVTAHLESVLKNAGHKVVMIKLFDKKDAFLTRLEQMNSNLSNDKLISTEAILNTIKAVSL